jgi:O-antigen ligase
MIRYALLMVFVGWICATAWRDRFVALCGLVLLSVVSQHPDMPTSILGIPGLNPWNFCLFMIALSFFSQVNEPLPPAPLILKVLLGLYGGVLAIGAVVCLLDLETIYARRPLLPFVDIESFKDAFLDLVANPAKYVATGIMLYLSCRTRKQVWQGIITLCLLGVAYSALTYKALKANIFLGDYNDVRRLLSKLVGVHANDLAGLLTMCFWAAAVVAVLQRGKYVRYAVAAAACIFPAVVGCQSRAAYVANAAIAFALSAVRFRRMLLVFPLLIVAAVLLFPQVASRVMMGFDVKESTFSDNETDWNEVTAGRTYNIWEPVIRDIEASPIFGHGRLAIARKSCTIDILKREGFVPTHPHNSYLELMIDSGVIGLSITLALLVTVGYMGLSLLWTRGDPLVEIVGACGFLAVVNVMVLGMSSTFFYPKESSMWLLLTIALTTRIWAIQRERERLGVALHPALQAFPQYPVPYPAYGASHG